MTLSEACDYVLPFPKYQGQTITRVGNNDSGLRYLDWLMGQKWFPDHDAYEAVSTYLQNPAVASRLRYLVDQGD